MTDSRPEPRQWRGKALIALFASIATLAGAQALGPAPAAAMVHFDMTEAECNMEFGVWSWFDNSCDVNFGGSGGGGPSNGGVGGGGGGSSDGGSGGGSGGGHSGEGDTCPPGQYDDYPGEGDCEPDDGGVCSGGFPDEDEGGVCIGDLPDQEEGGTCPEERFGGVCWPDPSETGYGQELRDQLNRFKEAMADFQKQECGRLDRWITRVRSMRKDGVLMRGWRGWSKKERLQQLEREWRNTGCNEAD